MADNARFSVAVHILCLLAEEADRAYTSEVIAGSVNTNPVVIRRLLGTLARARLVHSIEGAGGGTALGRSPDRITLAEVYAAVDAGPLFGAPRNAPNPKCPVGRNVAQALARAKQRFERALNDEMSSLTIADVLADVRAGATP